VSP
jgi:hypothetical protein